jgi:hypothetical protein
MVFVQLHQLREQYRQRRLGIKEIKKYLDTRLKTGPERASLPGPKKAPVRPDALQEFISTMFHLRMTSGKTIIYRTHWFILVQKTWLPGSILLGMFFLFVASAASRFSMLSAQATCGLLALLGLMVGGWWFYQYMDWHNDLYLITPDQVVDLNKKPLGQEDRMAAPIKNIQNIEYKRLGIIGRLLNYGTVYIRVGDRQLTFDDVFRPSDVQRELFHALMKVKADEREKQAKERQVEFGDWFDSYTQVQKEAPQNPPPERSGF